MSVLVEYRKESDKSGWTAYGFSSALLAYSIMQWLNAEPSFQEKKPVRALKTDAEKHRFFTNVLSTVVYMTFGDRVKVKAVNTGHFDVVYESDKWVVITHQIRLGEEKIWLFFYREDNWKFRHVEIPAGCNVDREGVIRANYYNRMLLARPWYTQSAQAREEFDRWPGLLINPELYFIREDMAKMLVASDTNPLTGLIRSPGPMRTLAHQVAKQVEDLLEELEKL